MNKQQRPLPTLSQLASKMELTPLQVVLATASRPDILSLAAGLPEPAFFPSAQLAESSIRVLRSNRLALQYALPCAPLKEKICRYMLSRGVVCSPDCILLTQGAQQAITLLATLLLDQGSPIIEEEISYTGFQHLIDAFRPEVLSVPNNSTDGVDVDALERRLLTGSKPALMYLMPTAHNPLGVSLSIDKRLRLADLARRFGVPIIEDDPYGGLFYDAVSVPSIRSIEEAWVYYIGSFSKILGPSLRIGWLVAPREHIRALSAIKEGADLDIGTFSQWVVNDYLETHDLQSHLDNLRVVYEGRRDAMNSALTASMPLYARWQVPGCGLYFWVELPESMDASKLLNLCIEEEHVAFLPGEACSRGKRKNAMRLNFSQRDPCKIAQAIEKIAAVLKRNDADTSLSLDRK